LAVGTRPSALCSDRAFRNSIVPSS
jgi:hypothetical protein